MTFSASFPGRWGQLLAGSEFRFGCAGLRTAPHPASEPSLNLQTRRIVHILFWEGVGRNCLLPSGFFSPREHLSLHGVPGVWQVGGGGAAFVLKPLSHCPPTPSSRPPLRSLTSGTVCSGDGHGAALVRLCPVPGPAREEGVTRLPRHPQASR